MNLNPGRLHVTHDLVVRSPIGPGDRFAPQTYDPMTPAKADQSFAAQGVLADARVHAEPAGSLTPIWPDGRRGRDTRHRTISVLLVDDDAADVIAIRRSFWHLKIVDPLVVARNGLEALDILRGDNDNAKLEAPYLILLDLNMPRMGGIEFLETLRGDPALRPTLVFVMTTSAAPEDRERAYEMNIAGFVPKPAPGETFTAAIGALEGYWRAIEFPD
jgi:CheY-like chemotaxis protein